MKITSSMNYLKRKNQYLFFVNCQLKIPTVNRHYWLID